MTLAEPATVLTDFALALEALGLAWFLARSPGRLPRLWSVAFVALAIGAVAGGSAHGFAPRLGATALQGLWLVTYYTVGLANMFLLCGAIVAVARGGLRYALFALALVRFAAFVVFVTAHQDFRYVVYDYALTLAALAAIGLLLFRDSAGPLMLAAVAVSALSAVVQRMPWALPPLNHNDLFHLVQMIGLILFYLTARARPSDRAVGTDARSQAGGT
jgi:hypothetical protein